jgi:general secretion pathway protein B
MSFILDALRKSETERQHKGSAEFANVPTSDDRREGPPAWLWVLGVLLLINLAVLIGIFLRPDVGAPEPIAASAPAAGPSESAPAAEPRDIAPPREDFASRVAAARGNPPVVEEPSPMPVESEPAIAATPTELPAVSRSTTALPTIHEVRAQGLISLPDLHVDIHVFSESARDRFVFINMTKLNEGSRLSEGPLVEEITPDGVVLSMNGTTFLLPRD